MKSKLKFQTLQNLPGCPKGRIFKEDDNGDFFHSMTDAEALSGEFVQYHFKRDIIFAHPLWFEKCVLGMSVSIQNLIDIFLLKSYPYFSCFYQKETNTYLLTFYSAKQSGINVVEIILRENSSSILIKPFDSELMNISNSRLIGYINEKVPTLEL